MTSIIAKHNVLAQFWVQDSIFDTSIQPRFINHTMLPVSPLIKQAVERGVAYLVTYKSDWIPAVKNGKGEIVKRAHCLTYDRRIVDSIMANGRSGYVGFREQFFQDYSELKDYVVFSNEDASYSFEKIADSITLKEMQSVAKGDGNSKTISARDSQQSSYVLKLLCIKAIPYGY